MFAAMVAFAAACGGSTEQPSVVEQADAGQDAQEAPDGEAPETATPDAAAPETTAPDAPAAEAAAEAQAQDAPAEVADCMASLTGQLSPVIDGLLFMSESDYPFEFVSWADAASGPLTPQHLLELLNLPADTVVEQRTFDQFFNAYLLSSEDGARYQQMRTILESELTDTTVIRVGEIQVHVYLVGRNKCGQVAGLTTISIET
jgi:hypothetical protein